MRRIVVIIFLLFHLPGIAQSDGLPFGASNLHKKRFNIEFEADLTAGYVVRKQYQAYKVNVCIHDVLFHRLGGYTSIEAGYGRFHNIYGGTVTILPQVYLFAGFDFFGQGGLLSGEEVDPRKEVGIGIIPYKSLVIRLGYSGTAGPTVAAGFKFPIRL